MTTALRAGRHRHEVGLLAGLYALKAIVGELGGLPFERLTFIANPDEEIGSPTRRPHPAAAADVDACLVLECARANGDIVSARKGILDTRADGRTAARPTPGSSRRRAAARSSRRARIVRDLHALNGRWPGVTVNVGKIAGGTRPNVVAERCDLEVDVRATTAEGLREAEAAIRAVCEATEVPDTTVEPTVRWHR